jgi:hypothetical protein
MVSSFTQKLRQSVRLAEFLRGQNLSAIEKSPRLMLHAVMIERTIGLLDAFRAFPTEETRI